jgi:hypothetical protein
VYEYDKINKYQRQEHMVLLNKKIIGLSICFLFAFTALGWGKPTPAAKPRKMKDPELAGKTNPHWTGKHCTECHEKKPKPGKPVTYKFGGDFIKLCNSCHDTALFRAGEHIVGVEAKENKYLKKPPADFPLNEGKLTCITCHDVRLQEQPNLSAKESNPMFLRGFPYKARLTFEWNKSEKVDERYSQNRYVLCFKCHREGPLLQWSPHQNQIKKNGDINEELCLFCHFEVPDRNAVDKSEWKIRRKLQDQCINCHMGKTRLHPIRVTHYGNTLPDKINGQINFSKRRIGLIIPLGIDDQGISRLTCPSCHNPHQRGVSKNEITKKGADAKSRLRLEGFAMCLACHGTAVGVPTPGTPF